MVSSVPQGSVLGPLLFISYINDAMSLVSSGSELNLFADDVALYQIIKCPADYDHLLLNIDSGSFICGKLLKFNAKKCRQMLISRKTKYYFNITTPHCRWNPLTVVSEYKYLDVTIASDLLWNSPCTLQTYATKAGG